MLDNPGSEEGLRAILAAKTKGDLTEAAVAEIFDMAEGDQVWDDLEHVRAKQAKERGDPPILF